MPLLQNIKTVHIKLTLPIIEAALARCNEKIAQSTELPKWKSLEDKGGYTVQPVLAPLSIPKDKLIIKNAGTINQKLKLFIRGNAISGTPIYKGINQLPNLEIRTGIKKKKIIKKAWAVTLTL
jgi:hypothetical protein